MCVPGCLPSTLTIKRYNYTSKTCSCIPYSVSAGRLRPSHAYPPPYTFHVTPPSRLLAQQRGRRRRSATCRAVSDGKRRRRRERGAEQRKHKRRCRRGQRRRRQRRRRQRKQWRSATRQKPRGLLTQLLHLASGLGAQRDDQAHELRPLELGVGVRPQRRERGLARRQQRDALVGLLVDRLLLGSLGRSLLDSLPEGRVA